MFRSDGDRRSFSLTRDITVIGRREDCDLRIPLGDVSRKHCRLVRDGDSLRLEDLGSSNGTYHNGQRVQEAILSPGDSIQVGPLVFVLQIDGVPADEELAPVDAQALDQGTAAMPDENAYAPGEYAGAGAFQELPTIDEGLDALEPIASLEDEPLEAAPGEAVSAPGGRQPHGAAAGPEELPELESLPELEPAEELEPISELEPVSELDPASNDDLGFEPLGEDALELGDDAVPLEGEHGHEHEQPHH